MGYRHLHTVFNLADEIEMLVRKCRKSGVLTKEDSDRLYDLRLLIRPYASGKKWTDRIDKLLDEFD